MSCWPYSTAVPPSTRVAPTIPSAGDGTSCGTPMTLTVPRESPARTRVPDAAREPGSKIPTAGDVAITRDLSPPSADPPDAEPPCRPVPLLDALAAPVPAVVPVGLPP